MRKRVKKKLSSDPRDLSHELRGVPESKIAIFGSKTRKIVPENTKNALNQVAVAPFETIASR